MNTKNISSGDKSFSFSGDKKSSVEWSNEGVDTSDDVYNFPGICFWDLEDKNYSEICYSEYFSVAGDNDAFYLELYPRSEGSAYLLLMQIHGDPLKFFCLKFGLRYSDKKTYFFYQNSASTKTKRESFSDVNTDELYDIKIIKTSGLKEIVCFATYAETFDETENFDEYYEDEFYESDDECHEYKRGGDYYDEDSDHDHPEVENDYENNTNCTRVKCENEREISEETESLRTRGQNALIENLREIFLNEGNSDAPSLEWEIRRVRHTELT